MTPEQQNIAIAKACGWELKYCKYHNCETWHSPTGVCADGNAATVLPRYTEDLNACAEMEEVLTNEQRFDYVYALNEALGLVPLDSPASFREVVLFAFANATAPQRAEAFLRTLGLFEEGEG